MIYTNHKADKISDYFANCLAIIELNKIMNKKEEFTVTEFNFATNDFKQTSQKKAPIIKIGDIEINSWTKLEYNKNTTLKEFKDFYEDMFKTTISMIVKGSSMIYADF